MFLVNDDLSIYATRGDIVCLNVSATDDRTGEPYEFQPGDILQMKIYVKKDAENVVLQKDFPVPAKTNVVGVFMTESDTRIGDVISKPVDYWYEVTLNPYTNPQTFIGYDEDGAKIFKLFPEGNELEDEPVDPEAVAVVDTDLDLTSSRPVQNRAIARAVTLLRNDLETADTRLTGKIKENKDAAKELNEALAVERARIDNLVSGATAEGSEVVDIRVGADGKTYASAGTAVREQINASNNILAAVIQADGEANPLQPILFDCARYYKGSNADFTETPIYPAPKYGMVDLDAYKAADNTDGTAYAIYARLKTPVPAFESFSDVDYKLIVKTSSAFKTFFMMGHYPIWSANTKTHVEIELKAGYNVIDLEGGTFVDELAQSEYRWVGFFGQSWANNLFDFSTLETLEMYLVRGDAFIGWVTDSLNELEQRIASVENPVCNIVCWGDSLTAQGGWTSTLESLSGIPVKTAGIGGESSQGVMVRQGSDVMLVNNIVIPADATPVVIAAYEDGIKTEFGRIVRPLLQGGSAHVNPVMIGDIEGSLTWTGSAYDDRTGTWTFTRANAGESVTIDRPTAIRTAYDRLYNDSVNIPIIFMGTNDGVFDVDTMVNQHRLMLSHAKADKFLVLGLSRVPDKLKGTYENAMRSAFGRNFLSLREYMIDYGLLDQGLTATEADIEAVANGNIPPQLTRDGVHFTDGTKTMVGNLVYKRFKELGYI